MTPTEFPSATTLGRLVVDVAKARPQGLAIAFGNSVLTYSELEQKAADLAQSLWRAGFSSQDVFALEAEDGFDLIVAICAVSLVGAPFAVLDDLQSETQKGNLLERLQPNWAGKPSRLQQTGEATLRVGRSMDGSRGILEPASYAVFTSGTTGRPKAVLVADRGLANLVQNQRTVFNVPSTHRVLQWSSWAFDAAIFDLAMAFGAGATLVLARRAHKSPGLALSGLLASERIDLLTATPSVLALTPPPTNVSQVISAGERLTSTVVETWGTGGRLLYNAYGPAEATVWVSHRLVSMAESAFLDVGRAIVGVEIGIDEGKVGEHDSTGPNRGEVVVSGEGVALGYLEGGKIWGDSPGFVRREGSDIPLAYRTGDIGSFDDSGNLVLAGRVDRQIKLFGMRIELDGIDQAAESLPSVAIAASVVVGDGPDSRVVTFIEGDDTGQADEQIAVIRNHIVDLMGRAAAPTAIRILRRMPLTGTGKVDFERLTLMAAEGQPPDAGTSGEHDKQHQMESEVQRTVTEIFRECLENPNVGPDDDLFDLGGNSLRAMKILVRLADRCGVTLEAEELFAARTIRRTTEIVDWRQHG